MQIINKKLKFLIVGLGLIGGSYARALQKKGFYVSAITDNSQSIDYALSEHIIDDGYDYVNPTAVTEADVIIFALYPQVFVSWIKENASLFKQGTIITDVTGVKGCIVSQIQSLLPDGVEFIAAHPMAGREVYGVQNSDERIFEGANYIVVPTAQNTPEAIEICKDLGRLLGFSRVSELSPEEHDRMIAFTSQMPHIVSNAFVKSPTARSHKGFSAGSYKALTRVAWLNAQMWAELFLENRDNTLYELDTFIDSLKEYRDAIANNDEAALVALLEDGKRCKEEVDG